MNLTSKIALGGALLAAVAAGGDSAAAAQDAGESPTPVAKEEDPHAALVERLGAPDHAERTKAYDALRAAGAEAREALRAGARSEDPEVKWSSRRLLRLLEKRKGGEGRPGVLRFGVEPSLPIPLDDESFRGTLENLRERLSDLEREFGGEGTDLHAVSEKDGERTEVRRDREGRVKVTLTRKGEDGAVKTETFEAESLEALEKAHPEVHERVKPLLGVHRAPFPGGFRLELPAVVRPVLGVGVSPVPPVLRTQLDLPEDEGIVVEEVRADSLASRLDLRRHDVLLRVNGVPVSTAGEVRAAVEAVKEGGAVRLDVLRTGKRIDLTGTR